MANTDAGGVKDINLLNTEYNNLVKQLDIIENNLNNMYTNLQSLNKSGWHGGSRANKEYEKIATNYQINVAKVKVFEQIMTYLNKYKKALNGASNYK